MSILQISERSNVLIHGDESSKFHQVVDWPIASDDSPKLIFHIEKMSNIKKTIEKTANKVQTKLRTRKASPETATHLKSSILIPLSLFYNFSYRNQFKIGRSLKNNLPVVQVVYYAFRIVNMRGLSIWIKRVMKVQDRSHNITQFYLKIKNFCFHFLHFVNLMYVSDLVSQIFESES